MPKERKPVTKTPKRITIHRLELSFDADEITNGSAETQAQQAVDLINGVLSREPYGLGATLVAHSDEIEVETEDSED